MKKILIVCLLLIPACTAQKPVSQAPTWNITLTDNSQWVVGDNNATESRASTTAEQIAKPTTDAKAQSTTSNMWILWLILLIAIAIGGYIAYQKWGKSWFNK